MCDLGGLVVGTAASVIGVSHRLCASVCVHVESVNTRAGVCVGASDKRVTGSRLLVLI